MPSEEFIIKITHEKPCQVLNAMEVEAILCKALNLDYGISVRYRRKGE